MDLDKTVCELWPKVCQVLGVDPDSIRQPKVSLVPYGVIELFGGQGIMYHKGDNTIMISEKVDRGQVAHELGEAAVWLSPDFDNYSEDLAKMVEQEVR
jgi:hypothetical protein